jgi:hypothetical protein
MPDQHSTDEPKAPQNRARKPAEDPSRGTILTWWPLDDGPFEDEEHVMLVLYAEGGEPFALRVYPPEGGYREISLTVGRFESLTVAGPTAIAQWDKWWAEEVAGHEPPGF